MLRGNHLRKEKKMNKKIWILAAIAVLVLAAGTIFAVAQRGGGLFKDAGAIKKPAEGQNTQWKNWPDAVSGEEQLPIPQEYYNADGSVKAEYKELVWRLEYFGNPIKADKWNEWLAYIAPALKAEQEDHARRCEENRAAAAQSGGADPFAGKTYEEAKLIINQTWNKPREAAVSAGLIAEEAPHVTLEQIRMILAGCHDYESIKKAVQAIQPYADFAYPSGSTSRRGVIAEQLWYQVDEEHLVWFSAAGTYDTAKYPDLSKLTAEQMAEAMKAVKYEIRLLKYAGGSFDSAENTTEEVLFVKE